MKNTLTLLTALLLAPLVTLHAADNPEPAAKPNIIYILADDFGLPDIGCYGSVYKTPNLDTLAAGGTRFEFCFAAPLCAPTRAMGMFGRYGFRTGVTDNGLGAAATPQSEVCIAKVLKQAGYATAVAGKWSDLEYLVTKEDARKWGFDEFMIWGERWEDRTTTTTARFSAATRSRSAPTCCTTSSWISSASARTSRSSSIIPRR
jgi:arylsulfatase A